MSKSGEGVGRRPPRINYFMMKPILNDGCDSLPRRPLDCYVPPCLTNLAVAAERGFAASNFDDEDEFVSDGFDDGGAPDLSDWD